MAANNKIRQIKIGTTTYDIEAYDFNNLSVVNSAPTPSFGGTATIGSVNGTNLTITIPGTNADAASGGTTKTLVTTGDKYNWNSKAAGNHTHTTTIAEDTGTNQLTLGYGKKYKITTGDTAFVFTMPSADDTNTSHSHSAGVGLVGSGSAGTSSGTYNYKVALVDETANTADSSKSTSSSGGLYAVELDKSGKLAVRVPWSNTTSFTITANATDGIFDLTGTNGTNAVTYALAPYASGTATSTWVGTAGNAGKFYLGTVAPSKDTRLNYNGYFYGTKLYSGGKEVLVSDNIGDQVTYSLSGSTLTITSK